MIEKKVNSDFLLELLTITNSVFNKYQNKKFIEKEIFGDSIISSNVPIEFQENEVKKEENFNKRYTLSAGVTGIAIIEIIVIEKFGIDLYVNELLDFKKKMFNNILKLRNEILQYKSTPFEIEFGIEKYSDDNTSLENNDSSFDLFLKFIQDRVLEVKRLLAGYGDCHNLLFHFDSGVGQIVLSSRPISYGSNTKAIVKQMVVESFQLANTVFHSL
ncbi:MAG: hypothetical protein KF763_19135 [Cyclobacteriaceae bacterium]|nr:hypothetical protein [Cyclobacteriaceae bacterium]